MNNNNNGLLVILSGPSGSGKDTILTELTKRDMNIKVSTSMTTRKSASGRLTEYIIISLTRIISCAR